jgi:hypothetical protein
MPNQENFSSNGSAGVVPKPANSSSLSAKSGHISSNFAEHSVGMKMAPEMSRKESNVLSIVSEDLEDSKVFTSVYDSFISSGKEDSISSNSSSSVSKAKSVDPQEEQEEQKEEVKMHDEYEFTVNNELLNQKAPEAIKNSSKNVLETPFRRVKMHKSSEIKLALYEDLA